MAEQLPTTIMMFQRKEQELADMQQVDTLLQRLSDEKYRDAAAEGLQRWLHYSPELIDMYVEKIQDLKGRENHEREEKKVHDQRRSLFYKAWDALRNQIILPFVIDHGNVYRTPKGSLLLANAKANTKDGELIVVKERPIKTKDGVEDFNPSVNPQYKRCELTISFPATQIPEELPFFREVIAEHQRATMGLRISKIESKMTKDNEHSALSAMRNGYNLAWRVLIDSNPPKNSGLSVGDVAEVISWKDDGDVVVETENGAALLKEGTFTPEEWCSLEHPMILNVRKENEK